MTKYCDTLKQYYAGYVNGGEVNPRIFADGFERIGPVKGIKNVDDFIARLREWAPNITGVDFRAKFVDEEAGTAAVFFNLNTSAPRNGATFCAELFTFENTLIKRVELLYDVRDWEKYIG